MRILTFIYVLLLILILSGCNIGQKSTIATTFTPSPPPYIQAQEDIINRNGQVENIERFEEFLNSVQQGLEDQIRVVNYTTEGAPILYDYEFKNNKIYAVIDTTRDNFGSQEIIQTTCTSIKSNENQKRTTYTLDGCTPSSGDNIILTIE